MTDGLSRNTDFNYDSLGNVASVTRLAGTGDAVATNYTCESTFSQLATVTDPLSHTTTFTRNGTGDVTTITDPLSHTTTLAGRGDELYLGRERQPADADPTPAAIPRASNRGADESPDTMREADLSASGRVRAP